MVILHAFLALASGFAAMMLLTFGLSVLVRRLVPSWTSAEEKLLPGSAFVNLGSSFLAAAAGGYVTAWVAVAANPLVLVLALAMVVLAMAALSALQSRGKQPIWYALALVAISPIGVLAGGLVRLRVLGIL
jgi:hypothetical protein